MGIQAPGKRSSYYSQLRFCVEINGANLVTNTGFEEIVALIRKNAIAEPYPSFPHQ